MHLDVLPLSCVLAQERGHGGCSPRADFHAGRVSNSLVGLLHPRQRVSEAGELQQGHRVPEGAPDMAKEVGDRAGEGSAYANLGNADHSQGDYAKAIEYHMQHLAIAKTGTSATRMSRLGTSPNRSSTTRSTW